MKIAFYAPLKSPHHKVPSGDRQMARALIKALENAGHDVDVVSQLRSFSKTPHDNEARVAAKRESVEIFSRWGKDKPNLWFSYHPYYKAPDFLALEVLKQTDMPVFTAEASLAAKRDADEWSDSQECVREVLRQSFKCFYFTDRDLPGLLSEVAEGNLVHLPPFIDVTKQVIGKPATQGTVQLITIGMMRAGVKVESYQLLAKSLMHIANNNWQLTIVGDGDQRREVEAMFGALPAGKIKWAGKVPHSEVSGLLSAADIFVWPGFGEAYGISYLEAQAHGLPVVAQYTHGVPFVVKNGETGILTKTGDEQAYAQAMLKLIRDGQLRHRFGVHAANFVRTERNLKNASLILDAAIKRIYA